MSSKSRKSSNSGGKSKRPATPMGAQAPKERSEAHHGLELPDELIHAPKETSKLRFVLMVGLVVVLLLIFAIPSSILNLSGRGRRDDPVAVQWDRPTGEKGVLHMSDLQKELRDLDEAQGFAQAVLVPLGITDKVTMRDAVRIHVLAQLAEDGGIRVTDRQLGAFLKQIVDQYFGGDKDAYKQTLQSIASKGTKVEPTVRRCMLAHRYLALVGYAGSVVTPTGIEAAWTFDHTEVSYDTMHVSTDEFLEAARADLPDDAGLEAWFESQPEPTKTKYFTPERRTSEVAVFRDIDSTAAAGLLAAYPPHADPVSAEPATEEPASGEDGDAQTPPDLASPEERAREYYDRVYFRRFVKPVAEPAEEGAPPAPKEFFSFDEVKDRCLAEAPVYFAMVDWLADLKKREEAGEEIDFAAETTAMGLDLIRVDDATKDDLESIPELADPAMANTIFSATPGAYSFALTWNDKVIGFAHTVSITEASLPPFAEIRDQVAEDWVAPQAKALAMKHMQSIWRNFPIDDAKPDPRNPYSFLFQGRIHRKADAELFRAQAADAGLEVSTSAFADRSATKNPNADSGDPIDEFLWANRFQFAYSEVDGVSEPLADADGKNIYLVRVAAHRGVPISEMSPKDYENYKRSARFQARRDMLLGMGIEDLQQTVGLVTMIENLFGDQDEPPAEDGGTGSNG